MTAVEKLELERGQIRARRARRREADKKDQARLDQIENELHRAKLVSLVGIPDAVVVRFKAHASDKLAFLNTAKGTVHDIKRTRARVTWNTPAPTDGYTGDWNWTIENLLPADEVDRQGYTIPWGKVS